MTQVWKPINTTTFNGNDMEANEYGHLQRHNPASQYPYGLQGIH